MGLKLWFLCVPAATKYRLERELAEAVQEESRRELSGSSSPPPRDGYDPGSDSDEEQTTLPPVTMGNHPNSLEMSLWSLDASATSSMDTSVTAETEVKVQLLPDTPPT